MVLKGNKKLLWLLLCLMSYMPVTYSITEQNAMLSIKFSKAMASLFYLRHQADVYYAMNNELLTSPYQIKFDLNSLYLDPTPRGNETKLEALEKIVIESDGRLKIYLTKPYGIDAYYGFKPRFAYKKWLSSDGSLTKVLEWDCITNMLPAIAPHMVNCDKDVP